MKDVRKKCETEETAGESVRGQAIESKGAEREGGRERESERDRKRERK